MTEEKASKISEYLDTYICRLKAVMKTSCHNVEEISPEQIIEEAKSLCSDYIEDRLIRSGLNLKQRKITSGSLRSFSSSKDDSDLLKSRINMTVKSERIASMEAFQILSQKRHAIGGCNLTTDDLSRIILYVGEVLELRHTHVYTDVLQQLSIRSVAEVNLRRIFMNVAKEIFIDGINWSKIVSLFAFAGALAVDCVLNGSSISIPRIKTWTVEFIENELVDWICQNGCWIGLFDHFTAQQKTVNSPNYFLWTLSAVILLVGILIAAFFTFIKK